LQFAYAVAGIKDYYVRPLDVAESLKRGFTRIPAGRNQNQSTLLFPQLFLGTRQKIRKQRKRNVLKSVRGSVPKFQHKKPVVKLYQRRRVAVEARISLFGIFVKLRAEFGKILAYNKRGAFGIRHIQHSVKFFLSDRGKKGGHKKSAFVR